MVEKQAYEVHQKLEKLIETIKFAPIGEQVQVRHALKLAGIDGADEAQEAASTPAIEAPKGAYTIDGNQPLASLKIAGFGPAKKKPDHRFRLYDGRRSPKTLYV